jgi:hypothetical protein
MNDGLLTVFNSSGQQVLRVEIAASQTSIDITDLPAGLYLVQYGNGPDMRTGRFVKE